MKKPLLFFLTFLFVVYTIQPQIYYSLIDKSQNKSEVKASPTGSTFQVPGKFNISANTELTRDSVIYKFPVVGAGVKLWEYHRYQWPSKFNLIEKRDNGGATTSYTDNTGRTSFLSIYNEGYPYNYFYVEVVSTPEGYKPYPTYNLVTNHSINDF